MKNVFVIALSIMVLTSCFQEVEEVPIVLNEDIFIVNASIHNTGAYISLNKAVLDINTSLPFIKGAEVSIHEGAEPITLDEVNTGIFVTDYAFKMNQSYQLAIKKGDDEVRAQTMLPNENISIQEIKIYSTNEGTINNYNFQLTEGVSKACFLEIIIRDDLVQGGDSRLIKLAPGTDFFAFIDKRATELGEVIPIEIRVLSRETYNFLLGLKHKDELENTPLSTNLTGPGVGFLKSYLSKVYEVEVE